MSNNMVLDRDFLNCYPVLSDAQLHLTPSGALIVRKDRMGLVRSAKKGSFSVNEDGLRLIKRFTGSSTLKELIFELADSEEEAHRSINGIVDFSKSLIDSNLVRFSKVQIDSAIKIGGNKDVFVPIHYSVELTSKCNLKCRYCYSSSGPENGVYIENPIDLLSSLVEFGVQSVELTGGEPLMHPQIMNILEYACTNFVIVALLTNGVLLNRSIFRILEKYRETMVVQIDLDSIDRNRLKRIAGADILDAVLENIKEVVRTGVILRVGMVVDSDEQLDEIEEITNLLHNCGVSQFVATPVMNAGRALTSGMELSHEGFHKFIEINDKLRKSYPMFYSPDPEGMLEKSTMKGSNCGAGHRAATIGPDLSVRPCSVLPPDYLTLGKYDNGDLESSLNTSATKYFFNCEPPRYDTCDGCLGISSCLNCFGRAIIYASEIGYENCKWLQLPEQRTLLNLLAKQN